MRITNLRTGFATNSSSSHSILIMSDHHQVDDERYSWDSNYGWESFTLVSDRLKMDYLIAQLAPALGYSSYAPSLEDRQANARALEILESLLGVPTYGEPSYVDHQSAWSWPLDWFNPERVDADFVQYMIDFVKRDDVLILGGNDNDGTHPLLTHQRVSPFGDLPPEGGRLIDLARYGMVGCVARQDKKAPDSWTLFNRGTGSKMRLWFGPSGTDEPARAFAPELVDIKITDYCPFACAFCYQDSTLEGQHASTEDILYIASELGRAKVFEVAIGGGEPTLHPRFVEILKAFHDQGIVANFTTRNLGWLQKPLFVNEVRKYAGTFAYSAQDVSEIERLAALIKEAWVPTDEERDQWPVPKLPNVHIVMGTVSQALFTMMLEACKEHNLTPTLLGYKRIGRADAQPEHPYLDWWLEQVENSGIYRIGVDTALAAESEDQFIARDIKKWKYHTEDGLFSAYIDAVAMKMAPSSWEPRRTNWPFDVDWQEEWQACS